jgi:pyridoxine 4-dehydrogenase
LTASTFSIGGDMTVSRIGYGAMALTGLGGWGEPPDPGAAKEVLRRALDLGVQLFDTADSYGPEVSEQLLADALHPYPRDVVIATKGGSIREGRGSFTPMAGPRTCEQCVMAACSGSVSIASICINCTTSTQSFRSRNPWARLPN